MMLLDDVRLCEHDQNLQTSKPSLDPIVSAHLVLVVLDSTGSFWKGGTC